MRQVDFIKSIELHNEYAEGDEDLVDLDEHEHGLMYLDPSASDLNIQNIKKVILNVATLGKGQAFSDYSLPSETIEE